MFPSEYKNPGIFDLEKFSYLFKKKTVVYLFWCDIVQCLFLLNVSAPSRVTYQRKRTTLMYKNLIYFFSFPCITQNVRMGCVREIRRRLSWIHMHTGVNGRDLLWATFLFFVLPLRSKSPWLYILDAHSNSRGYISKLLLTRCTWSHFLLACHPRNLHGISAGEHLHPVYFRSQVNF